MRVIDRITSVEEGGSLPSGGGVSREILRVLGSEMRPDRYGYDDRRWYILLVRETPVEIANPPRRL